MPQIHCTRCDELVRPADVDLGTRLAKCACGNVFDISSQVTRVSTRDLSPPPAWTVEESTRVDSAGVYRARSSGTGLVLTRRWRTPSAFFVLAFAATWDGFLVFWYATLVPLLFRADAPRMFLTAFLLFPLLFVAVGVRQTYAAIAQLVNRTVVCVEPRALTIRHAPLPWPGGRSLSLEGLRAFFVRRSGSEGDPSTTWTVLAEVGESATHVVLARLSEEDARFVAARLAASFSVDGP